MPISGIPKTSVASKTAAPSGNVAARAPWLKDAGKTASTTQAPWSKRNATTTSAPSPADKSNGTQKEVKLQSREIKVPVVTQRKVSVPIVEPAVKPKPVKVTVPEDEYETSSSEYEEVTDSEEEVTETESDSSLEADDENKHKLPIEVKLKPVQKPNEVKKSPSVDRAGKFVKPALKKVPTLDKLNKPKPLPPTIPEAKPLRHVEKPILPEEKDEPEIEFKNPQLRKSESTTKKSKYTLHVSFCFAKFVFSFKSPLCSLVCDKKRSTSIVHSACIWHGHKSYVVQIRMPSCSNATLLKLLMMHNQMH